MDENFYSEMSDSSAEREADEMRNALSAIANEVQKLQQSSVTANEGNDEDILTKLIKYKAALNSRTLEMKHLRLNLRTTCAVAKAISSSKETEIATLNKHLDYARLQYWDSEKKLRGKNEIINKLRTKNDALCNQLNFFKNAIQLGYQELQGIRNESLENISPLEQLKYIIVCCGEYYTEHYNEHERCVRLQQRNRFLNTKMIIMENHLEAARDELRAVRCIKPNTYRHRVGVVSSDYRLGSHQRNFTKLTTTKIELTKCSSQVNLRDLDLKIHLNTIRNLLNDYDNQINDLKSLSRL